MKSRKIAANYIFLPGYPLLRNGYIVLEDGRVTNVVDTGGVVSEIPCLEFYGGMLVSLAAATRVPWQEGDDILARLRAAGLEENLSGLALIEGADLHDFRWLKTTRLTLLR